MQHSEVTHLELYILNGLDTKRVADLEEHLLICEQCRHRLDQVEGEIKEFKLALA